MLLKEKFYDGMGSLNGMVSRTCFCLSRFCRIMEADRAAMDLNNMGRRHASKMLKYWIRMTECRKDDDVKVVRI